MVICYGRLKRRHPHVRVTDTETEPSCVEEEEDFEEKNLVVPHVKRYYDKYISASRSSCR